MEYGEGYSEGVLASGLSTCTGPFTCAETLGVDKALNKGVATFILKKMH